MVPRLALDAFHAGIWGCSLGSTSPEDATTKRYARALLRHVTRVLTQDEVSLVQERVAEPVLAVARFHSFNSEEGTPYRVVAVTAKNVHVFETRRRSGVWQLGSQLAVCDRTRVRAVRPKPRTRFITLPYWKRLDLTTPSADSASGGGIFE